MPGDQIVALAIIGIVALVEKRQVVKVYGIGRVISIDHRPTAAEVVGPARDAGLEGDVVRPQKGRVEACRIAERRPGTAEGGRGQGAEKAVPVAADALYVGQICAGLLDVIDIIGLEEIKFGIRIDDNGSIEAVWEVRDGSRAAVEISIVAAEEDINI